MIRITIEIQYSGTAVLLLVNPHIPHQNNGTTCPTYVIIWKEDTSMSIQHYKSTTGLCIQSSHCTVWKLLTISVTNWSHHVPTTKSILFVVSQDKWDTKKALVSPMKNALHVLRSRKRDCTYRAEVTSRSKKIKSVALAIVKLHQVWRHQSGNWQVSQSVSRKFCLFKFCSLKCFDSIWKFVWLSFTYPILPIGKLWLNLLCV